MVLKIRSLAFMLLLMVLFSGVVSGGRILMPSYSDSGEVIPGVYRPDTINEQNPNLLIGGIRQNSSDPNKNTALRCFMWVN